MGYHYQRARYDKVRALINHRDRAERLGLDSGPVPDTVEVFRVGRGRYHVTERCSSVRDKDASKLTIGLDEALTSLCHRCMYDGYLSDVDARAFITAMRDFENAQAKLEDLLGSDDKAATLRMRPTLGKLRQAADDIGQGHDRVADLSARVARATADARAHIDMRAAIADQVEWATPPKFDFAVWGPDWHKTFTSLWVAYATALMRDEDPAEHLPEDLGPEVTSRYVDVFHRAFAADIDRRTDRTRTVVKLSLANMQPAAPEVGKQIRRLLASCTTLEMDDGHTLAVVPRSVAAWFEVLASDQSPDVQRPRPPRYRADTNRRNPPIRNFLLAVSGDGGTDEDLLELTCQLLADGTHWQEAAPLAAATLTD